jgi:exodeoxyribonuclease-5
MTDLTAEQLAGIEQIGKWYEDAVDGLAGPFRLFGPAGTGKTTMAKSIPGALGTTAHFMTFTGKAAHVLQRKGVPGAKTIHSSIYYPVGNEEAKAALQAKREELSALVAEMRADPHAPTEDPAEMVERMSALEAEVAELESKSKRMSWEWNPSAFMETNPGLLILDEVSMVGSRLAEDIQRYGIPVLVLGDPAQLPPVDGGGYYTSGQPDYMLETIHRQALESPVLELATRIRLSQGAALGITAADMTAPTVAEAMEHDQVIVWSNKRRWAMIDVMRKRMDRQPGVPVAGDRIMCLTNNKDLAVFNGAQFTVLAATPTPLGPTLRLLDDDGHERTIPTFGDGFQGMDQERQAKGSGAGIRGGRMLATFSQAITCHKSQGSEWGSVYVVNELPSMMGMTSRKEGPRAAEAQGRQWLYTAVTRAADRVTITTPSKGR